jgi:outer membrane protease
MILINIFKSPIWFFLIFIVLNQSIANAQNKNLSLKDSHDLNSKKNSESNNLDEKNLINNSQNQNNSDTLNQNSLSIGIGEISGVAHEILYNYGKKTSHLEWNFKDVKMLNANYHRKFYESYGLNVGYANSINEGNNKSSMIDSDWLLSAPYNDGNKYPELWSHRSFSKITVKQIQKFDINGYSNELDKNLFLKLGYRYEKYKFNDNAYNYIYSNNSFRDTNNSFGGSRAISYQQNFYVPYIGLEINKKFFNDKIIFNIFGNYSPFASAKDIDLHHMTNTKYTGYFDNIKYYNWGANLSTKIYQDLYLGTSFDYTYYALKSGYMIVEEFNKNLKYRTADKNSAGISNKNTQYSIFLKYNFNSKF